MLLDPREFSEQMQLRAGRGARVSRRGDGIAANPVTRHRGRRRAVRGDEDGRTASRNRVGSSKVSELNRDCATQQGFSDDSRRFGAGNPVGDALKIAASAPLTWRRKHVDILSRLGCRHAFGLEFGLCPEERCNGILSRQARGGLPRPFATALVDPRHACGKRANRPPRPPVLPVLDQE